MRRICVETSKQYDVLIGRDLLKDAGSYIAQVVAPGKAFVIADRQVAPHYLEPVEASLTASGFSVSSFVFAGGEEEKSMGTVTAILEEMAEKSFTRSDIIVALGGGIIGDTAGFAAATFLRGINFIQIPTTFLAAVDSSVGGKTGVNLKSGKNLAGAFWQPSLVLCDCNTFATLPYEIFSDGIAEAIKYGAIVDRELFDLLESNGKSLYESAIFCDESLEDCDDLIVEITARCIDIKRTIVMEDERDTGMRQLLNFGHTLGHAVEKCSDYRISHGHAVAIGMVMICRGAKALNLSEKDCLSPLEEILRKFQLPAVCPFTAKELTEVALKDKKRTGGTITLVVPSSIGCCRLEKISTDKLEHFIEAALGSHDR